MSRGGLASLLLLLAISSEVGAQVRRPTPQRPTSQRDTIPPTARDSLRRDTSSVARRLAGDSASADTLRLEPTDSVMAALLAREGYTATRYEGAAVTFDANDKSMAIAAATDDRAVVEREGQRVVTDSVILYDDRSRIVDVRGRSFQILPGDGQPAILGVGSARYNLAERSGRVTNARVTVEESGQRWFINSEIGKTALGDSTRGIPTRFYGLGGTLTSCEDSVAHYHFRLKEIKRSENTLVARPAVLYIADIPVMWLPFVFQDIRGGRRSGILPPRFGASDIVRNNPGYRRHIENIGYYWAISDYMDFAAWGNWRSAAGADSLDPGWLELNAEWNYNWLSRSLDGKLALSQMQERDGDERFAFTWNHKQRLGRNRNFNSSLNYTTSTTLQRRNTFNPYQAIATIVSTVAFSDKIGPASLQVGGTQRQYPGRSQIDRTAPTVSITTTPLEIAEWLVWTPGLNFSESATLNIDQVGTFGNRYISNPDGTLARIDTLDKDEFSRSITFNSPIKFFGFDLTQNVRINDRFLDFPEEKIVYPGADSARAETRVFAQTYRTDIDWNPTFSLPPLFQNRFKITPSVTLSNVDPRPFWVRTELSGGKFVSQSKRLTYGLSAQPTIFGLLPGFGPFSRLRHSISPGLSYSFAPRATVPIAYLEALGEQKQRYVGSLRQNAVSFSLSQNIEAKVRTPLDTTQSGEGQKIKLLSMNFTPLAYDFERAKAIGRSLAGLTTENFGASMNSDLLPGFDLAVNYSLFQGSTLSDTAVFKPFLTTVSSQIRLSQRENPFTVLSRLFGRAVPERAATPPTDPDQTPSERALTREVAAQPIAGQAARGTQFVVPPTQGWEATFNFSTSRSRRPTGDRVIEWDPKTRCESLQFNPFAYDECLRTPTNELPIAPTTGGARAIYIPPQTSLSGDIRFELTQKWAATWNTSYDFQEREFASHIVSLQRDMHDWRAIFAFTASPNGNFAFNFFIALKPQPDLKFDYSRATVRGR